MSAAVAPPPRPRCLVVAGPPGSGKTTLAAHAARSMRAALVDKDALEWPLANAALAAAGAEKDGAYYNDALKPAAYETCFRVAEQNAKAGLDVVVVAPFSSATRAEISRKAAPWGRRGLNTSSNSRGGAVEETRPGDRSRQRRRRDAAWRSVGRGGDAAWRSVAAAPRG